jgi:hypothetical protein
MNTFVNRIVRAARLDVSLYEEVEADKGALGQSIAVVVLSSLAAGIGNARQTGMSGFLLGTLATLAVWYLWAYLIYFIGTRLLPEPQTVADPGELLRTIGFSSAPGLIRIFGIIPGLTVILFSIASVWMLVTMVIAVRQALDYQSTLRAIGVCLVGWIIQLLLVMIFFSSTGSFAASV